MFSRAWRLAYSLIFSVNIDQRCQRYKCGTTFWVPLLASDFNPLLPSQYEVQMCLSICPQWGCFRIPFINRNTSEHNHNRIEKSSKTSYARCTSAFRCMWTTLLFFVYSQLFRPWRHSFFPTLSGPVLSSDNIVSAKSTVVSINGGLGNDLHRCGTWWRLG